MTIYNVKVAVVANVEALGPVTAVRILDHQLQAAGFSTLTEGGPGYADAFEAEEGTEASL